MGSLIHNHRLLSDLDVVVIGGGDTGCDCIGTSLRQGAKSITTFEILPEPPKTRAADNPWPQYPRLFKVRNWENSTTLIIWLNRFASSVTEFGQTFLMRRFFFGSSKTFWRFSLKLKIRTRHSRGFQVDYGHEEVTVKWGGDPRRFNTQSKEFLVDENGRVSGVRTTQVLF